MNFKEIRYLIIQNWHLITQTKFSLGKNKELFIPRIYLIIPILLYLGYEAYIEGGFINLWILFLMSLYFFEMARIANRCFFDPIHLFYLNTSFKNKVINIILSEWFGVKFLSFLLFSIIAWIGSYGLIAFSTLICLYGISTLLFVFISIIGNRIRIISVVYQWILIIVFSFLFGFSGLSFTHAEVVLKMHLSFQDWIHSNFEAILLLLSLTLIVCYYMGYGFTKRIYNHKPFINPDSFPRKMI